MSRYTRRTRSKKKPGAAPGTLVFTGESRAGEVGLRLIDYRDGELEERYPATVEECLPFKSRPTVTWLNLDGLHDVAVIGRIGEEFGLHPLVVEDLLHAGQRPKLEEFDAYLFLVLRALTWDEERNEVAEEQLGLILGENFVLSFQERPGDVFDPVRERIRGGKGRLRQRGPDYLAYALMDAIVDHYFIVLERLGERIDDLEQDLIDEPGPPTLHKIYRLKRELLFLRKSVWPLREVLATLQRNESGLVSDETKVFVRDVYDHTIQVIDTAETFRDMAAGMLDTYLSSISNRMNEVMKVLTIIATIFIPITFVAGLYGMNFERMPELDWPWAYPAVLVLMLLMGGGMLVYFRRKGWL